MADTIGSGERGDMRHVVARLEQLPYCSWHLKMRLIICTAWFFDAFDSITIAYVLPPIIGLWHLNPQQIGLLIGIGFAGQLLGAIGFGWLAERWGRRLCMLVTLLIFSLGALACAAATSYEQLWLLRFIQGIGLGGETLTRIETTAAQDGKLVPPLPKDLPEVPKARSRIIELFRGIYLRRTISVWFIWIGAYFVSYGITAWVPSLFRTVYHLNVEQSLIYGLIISSVGLCGTISAVFLIDTIGRRPLLMLSLGGCSVPLISFAFLPQLTAAVTLAVATVGILFLSASLITLATYTAEIYPTHLRALGGGVASAWQRGASMVGTTVVGWVLPFWGINAVFVMFGLFALMGAVVTFFFAVETRAKVLERVSPV
jgi:MFS family permease